VSRQATALFLVLSVLVAVSAIVIGRTFTVVDAGPYDSHLFAYIGERWFSGDRLYVDIWDNKPPGIFLLMGLAASLGDPFIGIALFELAFAAAACLLVALLIRSSGLPVTLSVGGGLLVALMSSLAIYNQGGGLTELFLLAPSAGAIYCFVTWLGTRRVVFALLSGSCVGIGLHFKLPGFAPFLAIAAFVVVLLVMRKLRAGEAVIVLSAVVGGAILAWLPSIVFFSIQGGLCELLDVSFVYPFAYGAHSQPSLTSTITGTVERLWPMAAPLVISAVGVPWLTREGMRRVANPDLYAGEPPTALPYLLILAYLWLGADLAGATAGGRGYLHYYVAICASAAYAACLASACLLRSVAIYDDRMTGAAALLIIVLSSSLAWRVAMEGMHVARHVFGGEQHGEWPGEAVARAVAEQADSNDLLLVWDYLPLIYQRTGLKTPSRFTTALNLADSPAIANRIGPELLGDVKADPPTFVVIDFSEKRSPTSLPYFEQLLSWLEGRYELFMEDDAVRVYRRK